MRFKKHENHRALIEEFYSLNKFIITEQMKDALLDAIDCMDYVIKECKNDYGKYRWHDLRENPNDLPNDNRKKLVIVQHNYQCDDWSSYDLAYFSELFNKWIFVTYNSAAYKVIAWQEMNHLNF